MGASRKPSGVLVGHTEGITYVSAKGDGRYVISNGKDQAVRLWDLRKMHSSADFDKIERDRTNYGIPEFDYRCVHFVTTKSRVGTNTIAMTFALPQVSILSGAELSSTSQRLQRHDIPRTQRTSHSHPLSFQSGRNDWFSIYILWLCRRKDTRECDFFPLSFDLLHLLSRVDMVP